jgi:hypothetical protein
MPFLTSAFRHPVSQSCTGAFQYGLSSVISVPDWFGIGIFVDSGLFSVSAFLFIPYILYVNNAGGGKGCTPHAHTAGSGNGYTLYVHTAGDGNG